MVVQQLHVITVSLKQVLLLLLFPLAKKLRLLSLI